MVTKEVAQGAGAQRSTLLEHRLEESDGLRLGRVVDR